MERRLAAIMAADVVNYSRLIELDEAGTLAALKDRRRNILTPLVTEHHGRIVKVMGDGVLVEFASAVNAVRCAIELQGDMAKANTDVAEERRVHLRVGINLGDVVVEGGDLYGDGVIIAARLETIAEPGAIVISGTAYDQVKNKVKVAFDDLGAQTLKNMGEPVRVYRVAGPSATRIPSPRTSTDKPSIAVLPFTNMSDDPGQQYFSDGVTEDIITELARFRSLFVIARNSSFAYRDKAMSVRQVGHELGADFVLEGSIRRLEDRIRVTAQLIDVGTGGHIWAERYDRSMRDIFAIHDEIVDTIVLNLVGQIEDAVLDRARHKPPVDWKAYDHLLMGWTIAESERFTRASYERAIEHFEQAIAIDPLYARAYAWIAVYKNRIALFCCKGNRAEREHFRALARENARKALTLDGSNAEALLILGWQRLRDKSYEEGEHLIERAYLVNPNDQDMAMSYATALHYLGKPEMAVMLAEKIFQRHRRPPWWLLGDLGLAYFYARRNAEAVALFDRLADKDLNEIRAEVVCAYAYADRMDRAQLHAQRYIEQLRHNWAGDSTASVLEMLDWEFLYDLRRPEDVSYVREGLRKAGIQA